MGALVTSVGRASTVAPTAAPTAPPSSASAAPSSSSDGVFATALTAADNSTIPGDTDATTATNGNPTGNEEPPPSSPTPTMTAPTAMAPTTMAPTTMAPTMIALTASTNGATTSNGATTGDATRDDATTSDGMAEPGSAILTDSADRAAPASAGAIDHGIEPESADESDPAKIDADVAAGASLALGVSPVLVTNDVDRSGGSTDGPGPRHTAATVASHRSPPDTIATAAPIDASTIGAATIGAGPAHGQANDSTAPTPHASGVAQPVDVAISHASVVSQPVIAPTPAASVMAQPVIVPTPHATAAVAVAAEPVAVAAEPVAESAAAPVAEAVLHASTTAASADIDLADGSPAAERAATPARADAVRLATEVPAAVADRQAAASGPTPSSPSMVSSGTGAGVPVSATVPFAGADLAAWRHLRSGSTSTMSMEVDTDTLGQLRIAASDLDGSVRLSLLSDDALSRQLLAERLPELRRDLTGAGIDFADLDVADRNAGQRHSESSDRTDRAATSPTGPASATPDRLVASISSPQTVPIGHLDLRL